MNPNNGDSVYTFAWRLRNTFYGLSQIDRTSPSTRSMITDLCSKYMPRVWTLVEPYLGNLRNDQRVEKVVQVAERVCKWSKEDNNFTNSSNSALPSLDFANSAKDQDLYTSFEQLSESAYINNADVCYHCRKAGHWANNCPQKRQHNYNSNLQNNTRTNIAHRNSQPPKQISRTLVSRNHRNPSHQSKQNNRTYLINSDDVHETQQINPSQICALDPGEEDEDLNNIINDMENDHTDQ